MRILVILPNAHQAPDLTIMDCRSPKCLCIKGSKLLNAKKWGISADDSFLALLLATQPL
mgnify:CR=1 FL=1